MVLVKGSRESALSNPTGITYAIPARHVHDLLERNPESLAALRLQDYIERGGAEGAEVIMWLAMRGALSSKVHRLHRNYHGPLHTGFAQVIFEDAAYTPPPGGTP